MKANISALRKKPGEKLDFTFQLTELNPDLDFSLVEPVDVAGTLTNTGLLLELTAHVKTKVLSTCSRCLDQVIIPIDITFTEEYCHLSDWETVSAQLGEDNTVLVIEDEIIDLAQSVEDNLVLDLPMRILCREDCPGLCPHCGQNLKEGACQCQVSEIDPRLAILAKLKK